MFPPGCVTNLRRATNENRSRGVVERQGVWTAAWPPPGFPMKSATTMPNSGGMTEIRARILRRSACGCTSAHIGILCQATSDSDRVTFGEPDH